MSDEPGAEAAQQARGGLRPGWVVVAFAVVAVVTGLALHAALALLRLDPRVPYQLDDPRLGLSCLANLLSAVLATAVARAMGERAGFERPALLGLGALGGAALLTATVVLAAIASGEMWRAECGAPWRAGLLQLVLLGPTAIAEELWLRGAAFRALARATRPLVSLAATATVFGVLHLLNPSASPVAALNVALVGAWFGSMVLRSGSVAPAIGAHVAWNWFEGFVFGQPVSGIQPGCSVWSASAQGSFFSGGAFGPEASGLTAVLLALATAATWRWWPARATKARTSALDSEGGPSI